MTSDATARLRLGPEVVRLLLPHGPPLSMVDRVESFTAAREPTLRASRFVSANEEVFAGHFDGLKIWPGIYTIEGMGQSCQLLVVIEAIRERCLERGADPERPLEPLVNLERGFRLEPDYRAEEGRATLEELARMPRVMGLSTGVDVRFLRPVFPGTRVDYVVTRTHEVQGVMRFAVEAIVDGAPVARGTMSARSFVGELPRVGRER